MDAVIEDVTFVEVCDVDDFWVGEMRECDLDDQIVLLLNVNGEIRAYEDACPHQGVSLSEGDFDGRKLTCRAHRWEFDACTGQSLNPTGSCLRQFPVKVVDGRVFVGSQPLDDRA